MKRVWWKAPRTEIEKTTLLHKRLFGCKILSYHKKHRKPKSKKLVKIKGKYYYVYNGIFGRYSKGKFITKPSEIIRVANALILVSDKKEPEVRQALDELGFVFGVTCGIEDDKGKMMRRAEWRRK